VRVKILLCLRILYVPERSIVIFFFGGGGVITRNTVQMLTTLQLSDTPSSY
jgi:hypothetical protein